VPITDDLFAAGDVPKEGMCQSGTWF
jgi:hypothetical protein